MLMYNYHLIFNSVLLMATLGFNFENYVQFFMSHSTTLHLNHLNQIALFFVLVFVSLYYFAMSIKSINFSYFIIFISLKLYIYLN